MDEADVGCGVEVLNELSDDRGALPETKPWFIPALPLPSRRIWPL